MLHTSKSSLSSINYSVNFYFTLNTSLKLLYSHYIPNYFATFTSLEVLCLLQLSPSFSTSLLMNSLMRVKNVTLKISLNMSCQREQYRSTRSCSLSTSLAVHLVGKVTQIHMWGIPHLGERLEKLKNGTFHPSPFF